jgi:hypothetical protein
VTTPTLHVVFGSSPAGIVRRALRELGRQEQVLDLMDDLSLGPIHPYNSEVRGQWLNHELGEFEWQDFVRQDSSLPLRSQSHSGRLVAWYAPNRACSYAGFKWWLSQMDDAQCAAMSVPDLHFQNTEAMVNLVGQETDLSSLARSRHQKEWHALRNDNALLRVIEDGQLISKSLDFFDHLIIQFVDNEWKDTKRVAGNAFSTISIETGHFIDDLFVGSRLRALAEAGKIEWDGNSRDARTSKVRLAN